MVMAVLLLVVFAAQACGSAMLAENGQQKTPAPSSARTKGRARQICHGGSVAEASGYPHAAFRGTTSNTPGRCRSGALSSPTGAANTRAESGHRYNGLSRTDLLARIKGFLQSLFALGDLPRTGAGGTFSRVSHMQLTRSRSLCGAVARTPPNGVASIG